MGLNVDKGGCMKQLAWPQLLLMLFVAYICGIGTNMVFGPNQGAVMQPAAQLAGAACTARDAAVAAAAAPATCAGAGRNDYFPLSMNKTMENMLEYQALLDSSSPGGRSVITGNILWFPWQTFYYASQAANPCIRTICEIGFGAGHSTVLYTSVNPHAHIYSFDTFVLGTYQDAGLDWHKASPHGHRFTPIKGDSRQTVPQYAKQHPELKCDLIHVDGLHISPVVYTDIKNFKAMAHEDTIVLVDDANEGDTQHDTQQATDEGVTEPWECHWSHQLEQDTDPRFASLPKMPKHAFCVTRYKWP